MTQTIVFIAKSIDGFIADKEGQIDWLQTVPNSEGVDMGFLALMDEVDAVVMGRTTFDTVCSFGGDWPYSKPVIVLSRSLSDVPQHLADKVTLLGGRPRDILDTLHQQGYRSIYIDGGQTIQQFLAEDLVDHLRLTTIPILLGDGYPLFSCIPHRQRWELTRSEVFCGQIVQSCYRRKR